MKLHVVSRGSIDSSLSYSSRNREMSIYLIASVTMDLSTLPPYEQLQCQRNEWIKGSVTHKNEFYFCLSNSPASFTYAIYNIYSCILIFVSLSMLTWNLRLKCMVWQEQNTVVYQDFHTTGRDRATKESNSNWDNKIRCNWRRHIFSRTCLLLNLWYRACSFPNHGFRRN